MPSPMRAGVLGMARMRALAGSQWASCCRRTPAANTDDHLAAQGFPHDIGVEHGAHLIAVSRKPGPTVAAWAAPRLSAVVRMP